MRQREIDTLYKKGRLVGCFNIVLGAVLCGWSWCALSGIVNDPLGSGAEPLRSARAFGAIGVVVGAITWGVVPMLRRLGWELAE